MERFIKFQGKVGPEFICPDIIERIAIRGRWTVLFLGLTNLSESMVYLEESIEDTLKKITDFDARSWSALNVKEKEIEPKGRITKKKAATNGANAGASK